MPPPDRRRRGTRSTVLARTEHAIVREWIPADVGAVDAAQDPTVIKLPLGDDRRRLALAEAAALASLSHPHVVALRGLDDDGESLGVLLPRLSSTTAAEWLATRGTVTPGEAVTLLVPLLRALAHIARRRLDGSGSVDLTPRIALEAVLFDVRGAPVITGLRAGATTGPALLRQPTGGAIAAAHRLVGPVLAVTRGADPTAAGLIGDALARGVRIDRPARAALDELIEAVFALGAPEPLEAIDFGATGSPSATGASLAAVAPIGPETARSGMPRRALSGPRARRVGEQLRAIRRRTWLTAGILVVSALGAVIVSGPRGAADDTPGGSPSAAPGSPPTRTPPPSAIGSGTTARPTATGGATAEVAPAPASRASRRILVGDDAAAAAAHLLALRARCLASRDDECLTEVEEAASPILERDAAATRAAPSSESRAEDSLPAELTLGPLRNDLGGAMLFAAAGPDDEPASVLIARSKAGWRLRSITVSGS